MSNRERTNWLNNMTWQVNFYSRSIPVRRHDPEFEWITFERKLIKRFPEARRFVKRILHKLALRDLPTMTIDWMHERSDSLWDTRTMLADDLSKLLFDSSLILRLTNHRRFYFPRIDFDDLIDVLAEQAFDKTGFPHDYLGMPLRVFDIRLSNRENQPIIKVVTRGIQLHLVNSYRQYMIRRNGIQLSPMPGNVVYDCGACIGEVSLLFAGLVAPEGEVHLFDPIPLHSRFCELQASMNSSLAARFHINTCAVGGQTHAASGPHIDPKVIIPGAVSTKDFASTTLDDYAAKQVGRVDFIKMDIEGAEMEALEGSRHVIAEFKPRLAISGYHKPEDLWEIPKKIKQLNPNYVLMFGHHTPILWESVFYAYDQGASIELQNE